MITGRDFVFTGLQPWDISIGSNAKDIALEVSKHNRVLYVNTPLDIKAYWSRDCSPETTHRRKVIKKSCSVLRQINKNLWVLDYPFWILSINFLLDGCLFDWMNKLNNKRMYEFVLSVLRQLNFKDYILFIDNDVYRSFFAVEQLRPAISVYYRRDNLVSKYWAKHAFRLEPKLGSKCDLVVANSIYLAESMLPYNEKSYDVGQGLDLRKYDAEKLYDIPDDILNISRPIVGYVGWITSRRLDEDLIYSVAESCPDISFVMVGREDDIFKVHKVHSLKNVYFLGQKPESDVASYMAYFDICMNPQKVNPITIGNYPRKIDEYLALGKPVVATKTKAMEMFDGYVWNCVDADAYVKAIREALNLESEEVKHRRIEFARTHTWKNSVDSIYYYIEDGVNR